MSTRTIDYTISLLLIGLVACTAATRGPDAPTTGPLLAGTSQSSTDLDLVTEQLVYVPAYSDIFYNADGQTVDLAITLSVRNTDLLHSIIITTIDYYNTEGTLVRSYIDEPVALGPLASSHVVVDPRDESGGVGANFLVAWGAEALVHEPVVEAVMISAAGQQGLSLISPGRVISQTRTLP
ncbi:MAG: DUF3124 domain-containing protein [Chloroflexaceae bacterium]|nr:DUF3124 domain-containing protein [Chloroflexaceae bacterium]